MIDLADHIQRRKLAAQIAADIDAYCAEALRDDPRSHLGASVIAEPCQAKLWNDFRWLKQERHGGRMLRLFERGKLEESRFIRWLRGIGFEVWEYTDGNGDLLSETQIRITGVNGHFGGSLDAVAKPPTRYELPVELVLPNEYKTHNAKSFADLLKNGVQISKPMHFAQLSCYGRAYGFKYGLYVATNKDTDEIYVEICPLNWALADELFLKAEKIINSRVQPPMISQTATFYKCKGCVHVGICFEREQPQKNCRSCYWATPEHSANWVCNLPGRDSFGLSKEEIKTGCDGWEPIING